MKTKDEILKAYGCTYVPFDEMVTMFYPAILSAMEEYAQQMKESHADDVSDMLPDLETVRESGQKYANEKGGGDYGFAFRCYNAGVNWALNYITQKLKGNDC